MHAGPQFFLFLFDGLWYVFMHSRGGASDDQSRYLGFSTFTQTTGLGLFWVSKMLALNELELLQSFQTKLPSRNCSVHHTQKRLWGIKEPPTFQDSTTRNYPYLIIISPSFLQKKSESHRKPIFLSPFGLFFFQPQKRQTTTPNADRQRFARCGTPRVLEITPQAGTLMGELGVWDLKASRQPGPFWPVGWPLGWGG